jgi:hypothetical protein
VLDEEESSSSSSSQDEEQGQEGKWTEGTMSKRGTSEMLTLSTSTPAKKVTKRGRRTKDKEDEDFVLEKNGEDDSDDDATGDEDEKEGGRKRRAKHEGAKRGRKRELVGRSFSCTQNAEARRASRAPSLNRMTSIMGGPSSSSSYLFNTPMIPRHLKVGHGGIVKSSKTLSASSSHATERKKKRKRMKEMSISSPLATKTQLPAVETKSSSSVTAPTSSSSGVLEKNKARTPAIDRGGAKINEK